MRRAAVALVLLLLGCRSAAPAAPVPYQPPIGLDDYVVVRVGTVFVSEGRAGSTMVPFRQTIRTIQDGNATVVMGAGATEQTWVIPIATDDAAEVVSVPAGTFRCARVPWNDGSTIWKANGIPAAIKITSAPGKPPYEQVLVRIENATVTRGVRHAEPAARAPAAADPGDRVPEPSAPPPPTESR